MDRSTQHAARSVFAALLVIALAGGVAEAQTKINPGWNLFSPQQDVEIGQQSAAQADQQLPLVRDAAVEDYVNRIGQSLARNAGGPQFNYQFRVVNASDINAFALPGGYVYVNRGILENARNEGEVAGVIAHEIAHVALRHGTHQASKAYAAQAGLQILGGLLGGKVGQSTAQILNTVGGVGLNALFLKFSRDLETQADIRGAQILAASGYTPADMVSFFQQLEKVDRSKKTSWTSDHPAPPDRIARIKKESQLLRVSDNPTTNTQQLASVQSRLRGQGSAPTMADIARTGPSTSSSRQRSTARTGSVQAPSTSLSSYTDSSGVYRIGYPSNWKVYDGSGFGVTIAPEGGIGNVGGNTEVVYGAIISHFRPGSTGSSLSSRGGTTLESATNELIGQIANTSPHLRVINNSGRKLTIDGGQALAASLRGTNPNTGVSERVTVVTRGLADGHLMYLLFVTPEQEASRYSPVLQAMLQSLEIDSRRGH